MEKIDNENKKKIKMVSLIAGGLLLLVVGITYAIYEFTGTGLLEFVMTAIKPETSVTISYTENDYIDLTAMYPMPDSEGIAQTGTNSVMSFTVTAPIGTKYALALYNITEGATLKDEDVKIYLIKDGEPANGFTLGQGIFVSDFKAYFIEDEIENYAFFNNSFTTSTRHNYVLKAWIDEEYELPQTDISDGLSHGVQTTTETFSFKIKALITDQSLVITNDNVGPIITSFTHLGSGIINVVATDASGTSEICINNNATDVTGCTWNPHTSGTYEGEVNTTGNYYAHVRDIVGNIGHSSILEIANLDISGANEPALATGMIPVYYDSTNNVWRKADSMNSLSTHKWYDYDEHMWANAVTVNENASTCTTCIDETQKHDRSFYTNQANAGEAISMDDINTMLVWIPRFNAVTPSNYNGGTQAKPGAINVTFVGSGTAALDAFWWDNDNDWVIDAGENKSGYWVGKFEASSDRTCTAADGSTLGSGCNLNTINPKVIPNVRSWCGAQLSTYFNRMLAMKNNTSMYGFNTSNDPTLDTHMMKNNEWGAVAYLTQSIYGRCTEVGCSEIGINNNSSYITGYGAPAGSASTVANGTYETTLGQNASTTGNIYGIYDMSGGAWDFVMGNFNRNSGYSLRFNSGFSGYNGYEGSTTVGITFPQNKYVNIYTATSYTGHALNETLSWYSDYAIFVNNNVPWFYRGGTLNNPSNAGVFAFYPDGGNPYTYIGSRFVLVK